MQHVRANGIEIACEKTGSGPPIVLCHGGEGDHRNFFNFAPVLARKLTVITYDQRDTGETRNPPEPYTLADLGRDVGGLIAGLGYERAHLFGTSYGGAIAQEAVLQCPERIDHLILSATWPGPGLAVTDEFMAFRQRALGDAKLMREYRARFFSRRFAEENPDEVEAIMQAVLIQRSDEQKARRSKNLPDTAPRLPSVKAPTLVVIGSDDRICGAKYTQEVADLIPNSKFEWLEGLGHASCLENPELLADKIFKFLGV